jgi:pimeloyl-ACP methyl ester carboxylesterase
MTAATFPCLGELSPPRDVAIKADVDGTEQFYMEMLPTNFDPNTKYDLIIGLHGHGSGRKQFATETRGECASFRAFASKHGMIAITPDYRATTSYMGPKAEADVVQIIAELKAKYHINKVFLVGGSMGGASALTFAALHPDLIDGVTAMNGFANHLEFERFQDAIAQSFGGSKEAIPEEYKKRSAEFHAEALTMPIAMTVGENDLIVPPGSVLRLAASLKQLGRKVMVINRPLAGHATGFKDGMAAMEFMLTGVVTDPVAVAKKVEAAATTSSTRSGNGGLFFEGVGPTKETKGQVELGLNFYVEKSGLVKSFWFYQASGESGPHLFHLWSSDGTPLLSVTAQESPVHGWIEVPLSEPFPVVASTEYIVSYSSNSNYVGTPGVFAAPVKRDGIMAVSGLYSTGDLGSKAPDKTYQAMNYFLDLTYEPLK